MAITRVLNQIVNKGGTLYHVEQYRDSETGQVYDNEDAVGAAPQGMPEGPVAEDTGSGVVPAPEAPSPPDVGGGSMPSPTVDRSQASDVGNYPGGAMAGYGGMGGLGSFTGSNPPAAQSPTQGFNVPGYANPYSTPSYQGSPMMGAAGSGQMATPMTGLGAAQTTGPAGQAQRFAQQSQAAQAAQGSGPPDSAALRNMGLYNWDNPISAFDMKMRDLGINPFKAGNPAIQMLRAAAPGLAMAFQLQNAFDSPDQANGLLTGGSFGDYLGKALSGGNVFSSLQGAASSLPGIIRQLSSNYDQNPMGMSSIGTSLLSQLEAGTGQGTTNALFSLLAPMMANSQRSGYQEQLRSSLEGAQRNFWNQPDLTGSGAQDIWQYLLGR